MHVWCTPPDIKADIVRQYTGVNATLRIIFFPTSSFGMEVDCSGTQQVIHIGEIRIIYSRIGRAGQDEKPGHALLFLYIHGSNKEIIKF